MEYRISELMDGYRDDMVVPADAGVTTPERIVRRTLARIEPRRSRGRRAGRLALIAAAAVLALTAAALAVYQYSIRDLELPPSESPVETADTRLSAVGYRDSAEYQAYVAWEQWRSGYESDPADDDAPELADDQWYYTYYGACNLEMAAKLDEIAAEYGVSLHSGREFCYTLQALYDVLGTEGVFGFESLALDSYIYDDGSFKATQKLADGESGWLSFFCSKKGTFTDLAASGVGDGCTEWVYESGGVPLSLALGDEGFLIVADMDGCFVTAGRRGSFDAAYVESIADGIDFGELNRIFGADYDRAAMAGRLADYVAGRGAGTAYARTDETTGEIIARLGNYSLPQPPVGFYCVNVTSGYEDGLASVGLSYDSGTASGLEGLSLSYRELADGERDGAGLAALLASPDGAVTENSRYTDCEVGGCPAVLEEFAPGKPCGLFWVDAERGLLFRLRFSGLTAQQAAALAESVATGMYTGEEIVVPSQTMAEREALATAAIGDYSLAGLLPEDYAFCWTTAFYEARGMDGLSTSVSRMWKCGDGSGLLLSYQRTTDPWSGETVVERGSELSETGTPCSVGDYAARLLEGVSYLDDGTTVPYWELSWYDAEHELAFRMSAESADGTPAMDGQALLELAGRFAESLRTD